MDRTCLFVCHDFPPAAGSGPSRAVAFARYLPEHRWRPVVLTPRLEWAANRDESTLADIPARLHVVRTGSFEPRPAPRSTTNALATARSNGSSRVRLRALKSHVAHAL